MYIIGWMTVVMGVGLLVANFAAAIYLVMNDER